MSEEELLKKRFIELSKVSNDRGIITYTNFLNLNEFDYLQQIPHNELFTNYDHFGGYEFSERQMISFIPDALYYENIYPIVTLKITPKSIKFAEKLNHRDYLGSLLGLGIERNKVGDILLFDNYTIAFVHSNISEFILKNFIKVRNTYVEVTIYEEDDIVFEPEFIQVKGTVASIRLDSILALVLKESRSKLIRLIEGGKVFVNGKLITTNAYKLQDGDLISVRGSGKYQYEQLLSTTKKERLYVSVKKFI